MYISIHALRVEGDLLRGVYVPILDKISIHALRVEGDLNPPLLEGLTYMISIHALRVEGDKQATDDEKLVHISIHALRVEGDKRAFWTLARRLKFLSTPSGWRATILADESKRLTIFLSTPSGWRATFYFQIFIISQRISIHALRVEGDLFNSFDIFLL